MFPAPGQTTACAAANRASGTAVKSAAKMSIAMGFGTDVLRNRVSDVCVHNEINEAGDLGEWGAEGTEIPFKSPGDGHVRRSMGTIDSGSVEHVRAKAELPAVRIHDLRHTFALLLVSGGMMLPMIGKLLGCPAKTQSLRHNSKYIDCYE